jgi:hypothetical protein
VILMAGSPPPHPIDDPGAILATTDENPAGV